MLLVKTKLAYSKIHGIGLYADQFIPKGEMIWKFHPVTCHKFSEKTFYDFCKEAPLESIRNFLNYSYIKNNQIYYISDNTRFINHSAESNLEFLDDATEVASRDIHSGEELLENYTINYDATDFFNHPDLFLTSDKEIILKVLGDILVNH